MTAALITTLFLVAQTNPVPMVGPPAGSLVIDGGGEGPDTRKRFDALAGGPDSEFVLIATATEPDGFDGEESLEKFGRAFGVNKVTVLHTRDRAEADSEEFVAPLKTARGV